MFEFLLALLSRPKAIAAALAAVEKATASHSTHFVNIFLTAWAAVNVACLTQPQVRYAGIKARAKRPSLSFTDWRP